ncbi:MAG: phage integrase SAM-like domain-containing protein [Tannerellaceae bacterium]|jgi:hypothetical protein|nr:phage integrase SAM-like domain-containing protein [Tannerellaceae bacterium]
MNEIAGYVRRLNDIDSRDITVNEVISYLTNEYKELSFTVFASEYISDMINHNREHPASNYRMAVKRLHEYINRDNIFFSDITANVLRGWINGMMDSQRKRNLYPNSIKTIFNAAMLKYNDEDRDNSVCATASALALVTCILALKPAVTVSAPLCSVVPYT